MQHQSGTSTSVNITSVELSVDATSKSAANFTTSRPRPVSVPVHKLAKDPAFRKLVCYNNLYDTLSGMLRQLSVHWRMVRLVYRMSSEDKNMKKTLKHKVTVLFADWRRVVMKHYCSVEQQVRSCWLLLVTAVGRCKQAADTCWPWTYKLHLDGIF